MPLSLGSQTLEYWHIAWINYSCIFFSVFFLRRPQISCYLHSKITSPPSLSLDASSTQIDFLIRGPTSGCAACTIAVHIQGISWLTARRIVLGALWKGLKSLTIGCCKVYGNSEVQLRPGAQENSPQKVNKQQKNTSQWACENSWMAKIITARFSIRNIIWWKRLYQLGIQPLQKHCIL